MDSKTYRWHPNAFIIPIGGKTLRIFQPDARRNILAGTGFIDLVDRLASGGMTMEQLKSFYAERISDLAIVDATEFTLCDHAYRNSDMFSPPGDDGTGITPPSFDEFMDLLLESSLICDAWPPVDDLSKRGFADRFRGSFNEQLATEALLARSHPERWWVEQKFGKDGFELRDTPYKYIEESFLMEYFRRELPGKRVLDIGCGTGYWDRRMARFATQVVGMDYNQDYLRLAGENGQGIENLEFHRGDMLDLLAGDEYFSAIASEGGQALRFDFIFLIDVFLFLFDTKYQPHLHENRHLVLRNIRTLLRDEGRVLIMDPHIFWLMPWAGSETRPIGFMSEYRHRRFREIATLEEYSELIHDAGFAIRRIFEPDIDAEYKNHAPSDYSFMKEFPQWWAWELVKTTL